MLQASLKESRVALEELRVQQAEEMKEASGGTIKPVANCRLLVQNGPQLVKRLQQKVICAGGKLR